jgi:hypothetical protein
MIDGIIPRPTDNNRVKNPFALLCFSSSQQQYRMIKTWSELQYLVVLINFEVQGMQRHSELVKRQETDSTDRSTIKGYKVSTIAAL